MKINKYDIILDEDYDNIKMIYYKLENHDLINNVEKYNIYIDLFNQYDNLKDDINFIYYIIILHYINEDILLNYIRFLTSKLHYYDLINNTFKI